MIVNEWSIRLAVQEWTTARRKIFEEQTYYIRLKDVLKIGSVWQCDPSWSERVKDRTFDLAQDGWRDAEPAIVNIGTNGFVSLADGNHRISYIVLHTDIDGDFLVAVQFHYFDIGGVINPKAPNQIWDGKNLYFICFPRGNCGKCGPCRKSLPFIEEGLSRFEGSKS